MSSTSDARRPAMRMPARSSGVLSVIAMQGLSHRPLSCTGSAAAELFQIWPAGAKLNVRNRLEGSGAAAGSDARHSDTRKDPTSISSTGHDAGERRRHHPMSTPMTPPATEPRGFRVERGDGALPGSLHTNPRLAQWLAFDSPGVVQVFTGKAELGQGILTALQLLVAEELDVPLDAVRVHSASTA